MSFVCVAVDIGYHVCGLPETKNADSVTVYLPRQQTLTVGAIKNIMQKIETRGTL